MRVVEIITQGPQGQQGPVGPAGPTGSLGTGSLQVTGSVNATEVVVASVFVHPQVINSTVTIPADHNGVLFEPVSVGASGSITVEPNANLIIIPSL
jgi:hypothetical protein